MSIFGDDFLKGLFDVNFDDKLDSGERFMRDMFIIDILMSDSKKRRQKDESCFDDEEDEYD